MTWPYYRIQYVIVAVEYVRGWLVTSERDASWAVAVVDGRGQGGIDGGGDELRVERSFKDAVIANGGYKL